MFKWQHIFESALMRNQPIQLCNDVTVTLFLNQSSQNFELVPLYKILAEYNASYCHSNTFFERVLLTNRVLKISDDVIVTSFLNQSQQNFVFLFVIPRGSSVQNLSKIGQETKSCKKWEMTSL